jgi:Zn-finger nucleic acid-binding protein
VICPKCKDPLEPVVVESVEIDRCTGCDGVWFDRSELGKLLQEEGRKTRSLQKGHDSERLDVLPGVCPRDAKPLVRTRGSYRTQVDVDFCRECCGIWLDAGEFKQLKDANPDTPLGELI